MGCGRGCKICSGITAILVIILIVIAVVLYFTILKPKEPKITTKSVTLEYIKLVPFPFHLNVTLGLVVTINNPNYGSFKYDNSTTYVSYRGIPAAEAPIGADTIPVRAKHDISTSIVVIVDDLTSNSFFWLDYNVAGCLNFTSSTSLHGKATALKLFKIKVTTYTTCDISVFVKTQNASSVCSSKVHY